MRQLRNIVVHCTASPQTTTVESILRYWRETLGWKSVGYHVIVKANGEPVVLATDDKVVNGVAGHNSVSLHISYIGGIDFKGRPLDNRTVAQKATMEGVIRNWLKKYPGLRVMGHRDFLTPGSGWKDCPSFDAKAWWASLNK
jgi:N-acetylmuramoyl-L-alanine amidase